MQSHKKIIIFIHHPIFPLNLKVHQIGGLQNQTAVQSLLQSHNGDITIFCGHYHMESSKSFKNVKQFITPAISYQIKKLKDTLEIDPISFGYRIIEISDSNIISKVKYLHHAN